MTANTDTRACSVPDCGRPRKTRGWCQAHYMRWWHTGDVDVGQPIRPYGQRCTVDGCEAENDGRGLCRKHYQRWRKNGDPLVSGRRTLAERLWDKVVVKDDGCWQWVGGTTPLGYGVIQRGGRGEGTVGAHRVAYQLLKGDPPEGTELDHLCRNPGCVNPDHLEPVTHRENCRRGRQGEHMKAGV